MCKPDLKENPVPEAVVFDVGRVIVQWDLACLFEKLIADPDERAWFLANVVTEEWHFQHDRGRPLDAMIAERVEEFPRYRAEIEAYRTRFLETIPGRVPGTADLIEQLDGRGVPLFAITNFGDEFWAMFRPTEPLLDRFRNIVVSGEEKIAKPEPGIFELAEKRFGFAPEVMLFIDDNRANIDTAARLGWQVHHFIGADGLAGKLRSLGLID